MKIYFATQSDVPNPLREELSKRGLASESPDADIVVNRDPCMGVFTRGKKLTIYWEVDEFLNIGKNHYGHIKPEWVDIRYIATPSSQSHRPGIPTLMNAANLPKKTKKVFDYVYVGRLDDSPLYASRVERLVELNREGLAILPNAPYEKYLEYLGMGEVIVDLIPKNPENNLFNLHMRVFEAMVRGCLMVDDDTVLKDIFVKDVHYTTLDRFGKITKEEARKIAENSRQEVLKKHTWAHRAEQLLKDIHERHLD